MGRPRILLTHERFPPDVKGGGEYVVLRIAQGLIARGCEVRVLTTGDPALCEHEGVPTERLPIGAYAFNLALPRLLRAARGADLVQTFTYHACLPSLLAARRAGRPVVCGVLALFGPAWREMRGPAAGRAFAAWERLLVSRRYDRTVFLSDASRGMGVALGAPAATSLVIPPGIEHARLRAAEPRDPFVLFAGRLDRRKGVHHLMAAARALPDIAFRAVGWGEDVPALAAAAPANLEIVEERDGPAYLDGLARARILFAPSYAETFGVTVAEAMAAGCAVVSSVDTIDFAGARVAPGDEAAMIGALRGLWSEPARAAALGRENRGRAAAFRWDAHVDRLLREYEAILAAPRRAAPVRGE
jgi:glycosyltransferase involved in cell wall biosynthesis